mmetsp:Transcript_29322/g.82516  ORF Transcript_29322/g.82516 Transcript_29322/m.82516 type:complete len:139 (+) Transcript_29322:182-598(+)
MCSVCAAAHLLSIVHLNVSNEKVLLIKSLGISVCCQVAKDIKHVFNRLNWPSNLISRSFDNLSLSVATTSSTEMLEWNSTFKIKNLFKVYNCSFKLHSTNECAYLVHLLEMGSKLRPACFARGFNILRFCTVPLGHLV